MGSSFESVSQCRQSWLPSASHSRVPPFVTDRSIGQRSPWSVEKMRSARPTFFSLLRQPMRVDLVRENETVGKMIAAKTSRQATTTSTSKMLSPRRDEGWGAFMSSAKHPQCRAAHGTNPRLVVHWRRAGFPACRFGGLSSPPRRPDVRGALDVRTVLGTDSPRNRQARKPALRAHISRGRRTMTSGRCLCLAIMFGGR